ncbi:MAG: SDR family oxidoreductase [bacterium]|nr:SDR family oxidoreductase [bacterium]
MKILVTGGTGFVGAHVVRLLIQEGHSVRVLLRENSPRTLLKNLSIEEFIGDLTNPSSVLEAVKGCQVVFHIAGHVSFWKREAKKIWAINLEGTRNVVQACLAHKIERLIHTSSIVALGRVPEGKIGDETLEYDWGPYKINYNHSKYLAEQEVLQGIAQGLNAVIVNPAVVFGAGEIDARSGQMILKIKKGKIPFRFPGGCCACDVEDVARGHLLAWKKGKRGERYILGGENRDWQTVMELIAKTVDGRAPKKSLPLFLYKFFAVFSEGLSFFTGKYPSLTWEMRHYIGRHFYFSSKKAINELGYTITPFQETIRKSYQWFLKNGYC